MTSVEIPSSELIHFKEQVKKWLTIDQQIAELESKLRDLKKIRNKELEPQVTDFMVKFKINDLNTENGKIKCSTRNTKKGLTPKYIEEKLASTFDNNELVEKAMGNIMENREVVTTYKLAKVKTKN